MLKETEDVFYQTKILGIKNAIEMKKNGRIKVFDGTAIDTVKKTNQSLLYVELPLYNAPIMVHLKESQYDDIKKGLDEKDIPEKKALRYGGLPFWYFRLNDKQINFVNSISQGDIESAFFEDCMNYMKESIYFRDRIERIEQREKMRKESEKKDVIISNEINDAKDKINSETIKEGEVKLEKKGKAKYKNNEEFIDEDIVPIVNSELGKSLPDEYINGKYGLKDVSNDAKINYVYNTIYDFMKEKSVGQDKQEITKKAVKMFTYMKLAQRSFWSGVNGKKNREDLYTQISNEYEKGFENLSKAIDDNIAIEDLRFSVKVARKLSKPKVPEKVEHLYDKDGGLEKEKISLNAEKEDVKELDEENSVADNIDVIKDDSEYTKTIKAHSNKDLSDRIQEQETKNSKLNNVISHLEEYIANQKILIERQNRYSQLLEEASKLKKIIDENEATLGKQGETISSLEKNLFNDKGEK